LQELDEILLEKEENTESSDASDNGRARERKAKAPIGFGFSNWLFSKRSE
jgi:hypothetical protein